MTARRRGAEPASNASSFGAAAPIAGPALPAAPLEALSSHPTVPVAAHQPKAEPTSDAASSVAAAPIANRGLPAAPPEALSSHPTVPVAAHQPKAEPASDAASSVAAAPIADRVLPAAPLEALSSHPSAEASPATAPQSGDPALLISPMIASPMAGPAGDAGRMDAARIDAGRMPVTQAARSARTALPERPTAPVAAANAAESGPMAPPEVAAEPTNRPLSIPATLRTMHPSQPEPVAQDSGAGMPLAAPVAGETARSSALPPIEATAATEPLAPAGHAAPSDQTEPQAAILPALQPAPSPPPAETPPSVTAQPTISAVPAQQIASALMATGTGVGGSQLLTLRLHPEELGAVQIRIERTADGPAQVEITVARAETLALLRADSTALGHALDQAGIPSQDRSVTLLLAPPPPGDGFSQAGLGQQMSGQQMSGQGFSSDSSHQQGTPGDGPGLGQDAAGAIPTGAFMPVGSTRAGLDITA